MSVLSSSSSNRPSKMATLQKLKFLALHCGTAAQSPTRSPLIQLRRKKPSLLMLLSRTGSRRSDRRRECSAPVPERSSRSSLKELFGSSPPFEGYERMREEEEERDKLGLVLVAGGVGPGSPRRPGWTGLRYKSLLRRAWRPVLVTIPE